MVPAYVSLKPALLAFVGAAVRFEPALPGTATSIDVSFAPSEQLLPGDVVTLRLHPRSG